MNVFLELWWVFPAAIVFSTIAVGSGVSGALFFSPFFMLVVGLAPVQAVGVGLLTEVFGMGNGLRSCVTARTIDYATSRWLLLGAVPSVIAGALVADRLSATVLKIIFGGGLLMLAAFLVLVRTPEECEPGEAAVDLIERKSEGKGTTVVQARDGAVYRYKTCWRHTRRGRRPVYGHDQRRAAGDLDDPARRAVSRAAAGRDCHERLHAGDRRARRRRHPRDGRRAAVARRWLEHPGSAGR